MKENRKRDNRIVFRATEKEKLIILKNAKKSNLTVQDFCLYSSLLKEINNIDYSELNRFTEKIDKIDNNLNEIIYKSNFRDNEIKANIFQAKKGIDEIWHTLNEYLSKVL